MRSKTSFLLLKSFIILFAVASSFTSAGRRTNTTHFFIEYSRGFSTRTRTDLHIKYPGTDLTLHNIAVKPEYYTWLKSNTRFFKTLFKDGFIRAISALTEPYYSIRFQYLLKKKPHIGIGLEHIHFKIFLDDKAQLVKYTGTLNNAGINESRVIGQNISEYSISHGVNHVSFIAAYRLMLLKNKKIPDGMIQPFGSFSFGPAIPHVEVTFFDGAGFQGRAYSYQMSLKNIGLGLNAGCRFKLARHFAFHVVGKTTLSFLRGMRFDKDRGDAGELQTTFGTAQLQFGISLIL